MIQIKNSFVSRIKTEDEKDSSKEREFGAIIKNEEKNYPKTGEWSESCPLVENNTCIKCGICAGFCPEGAIEIKKVNGEKKTAVNYKYCKGCGICAEVCPKKAIKMK